MSDKTKSKFLDGRSYSVFLYYLCSLLYLEFLFKLLLNVQSYSLVLVNLVLYVLMIAILSTLISKLFPEKINRTIFHVCTFLFCLLFCVQYCVYRMYGFFFSFSLLAAAGQVTDFASDGIKLILKNLLGIVLLFLPFFVGIVLRKKLEFSPLRKKNLLAVVLAFFLSFGWFLGSLFLNKNDSFSAYELFYQVNNTELNVRKLGVLDAFVLDSYRTVFGFTEDMGNPEVGGALTGLSDAQQQASYEYNVLDIDFDTLIASESNSTLLQMHKYFANQTGTKQNQYTGMFEGKNLILFMAESFNEIAVSEELTPTLYKLIHEGFDFTNFYTPSINSTIGGEMQELTGLYMGSGMLGPWKSGSNYYPMGIATMYQNAGYTTYAYHDSTYTFQQRDFYLPALGFKNFLGCKNGLEERMNCGQWPKSDIEMIDVTTDDYINDEQFMVFYATVSGHGPYNFNKEDNAIAVKYQEQLEALNLGLSEGALAYLAGQMELDKALELLLTKLEAAGRLEDTVIALVGDHYPYYLEMDQVNELSDYVRDETVEVNSSNFILYNSAMKPTVIEKVGSQIDVLPTIYNLFSLPYDSRLLIGKDILSTEPGLAMFGNYSWVSDYGTYITTEGKFYPSTNETLPENYIESVSNIVGNRIYMSQLIMQQNYYRVVLP